MAEILINDITTKTLPGSGAFDDLMTANQLRLDKQYVQSRLRGADYAKVYLGSMEAIMQQSIVYILGRQEADKKADLINEQITKTEADTRLVEAQILKTDAETIKVGAETLQVEANTLKINAETALVQQETANAVIQGQILTQEVLKVIAETSLLGKQEALIDQQILKMEQEVLNMIQEVDLTKAKVWSEKGKVSDDCSIVAAPTTIGGLIGGQLDKIVNEGELLAQKVITEAAQTTDNTDVNSVLGKQKSLYTAQTDGFARDAEQKLAKIMADSWNTRRVTDEGITARNTGLEDDEINRVLNAAKNGIGLRWNIREVLDAEGEPTGSVITEEQNPANTFCIPEDPGCA